MGFSHSFIATKGVPKERLLAELGLAETDKAGDIDIALQGFGLGGLPGGWLLVACNDFDLPQKAPLATISEDGEVVCAAVEEHVMVSEAAYFRGGELVWRVLHDPEEGIRHLLVEGVPPAALTTLQRDANAEQDREGGDDANVDFTFDVPPKLAASLCGFEFGKSEGEFVRLRQVRNLTGAGSPKAAKPNFFARLLGRG